MTRYAGEARCARIVAAVTLASTPQMAANARPPRPVEPSTTSIVVQHVEVAVPVDDTSAEIEQMLAVAALAATIAAAVTKARLRRRYSGRPAANTVIDITDPAPTHARPTTSLGTRSWCRGREPDCLLPQATAVLVRLVNLAVITLPAHTH